MISPSQRSSAQTQFGHTVSMPSVIRHSHHHGHGTHTPVIIYPKTSASHKRKLSKTFSKLPFHQHLRHYGSLSKSFLKNLYHSAKINTPKPSLGEGKFLHSVKVWVEDFMSILVEDVKRLWKYLTGGTSSNSHSHKHSHDHGHHHAHHNHSHQH